MKLKAWIILSLFSLLGYAATLWLFPKTISVPEWRQKYDRNGAIAIAKEHARKLGADTDGWDATVSTEFNRRREVFRSLTDDTALTGQELFSTITTAVKLMDQKTGRKLEVSLNSDGKLLEFSIPPPKRTPSKDDEQDKQPEKLTVSDADRQIAQNAANSVWGAELLASMHGGDFAATRQGSRFTWKSENRYVKLVVRAFVREGKILELSLAQEFTPAFDSFFNARRSKLNRVLAATASIAIWPIAILVAIFYFVGLSLKRIQHGQGLIFLAVMFVLMAVLFSLDGTSLQINNSIDGGGNVLLARFLSWLLFMVAILFLAGSLYFIWTAGQSLAIRLPERKTISIELILRGKLMTKPVAASLASGLMAGGIIAAIPFLFAASGLFAGMELNAADLEDYFSSSFPALSTIFGSTEYLAFVLFGFMAPLISLYVKRPAMTRLAIFAVSSLGLIGASMVYLPAPALLITTLIVSLALNILYFSVDLLAVIAAIAGSQIVTGAATLLSQPADSLRASGWRAIAGLAVFAVAALAGLWKFREISEEETAIPAHLLETRVERERLKAEFNVAQRAQQQMLPEATPQIEGLEIAAVCLPSKEVGGDLYDFLSLPDGKLGIVVADVSGKGVPASLYMTLTKGLLASVSENTSDPGEILREVNRHLYEVCRRKMFVTLFLGVIDPATRNLTFARAGHNPTVFRRPDEQTTSFLKPKGMGLGLNSGNIFDRSLQVESLQLQPNDKLFFYSDGITEAMNHRNDEYGEDRLQDLAAQLDTAGAAEARDAVLMDVKQFLGSNQPQDDQTLVVVRVV